MIEINRVVHRGEDTAKLWRMSPDASSNEAVCPGCGLAMPARPGLTMRSYYNTSPECWDLYSEVLGVEYGNAVVFGQVHQLTVDAYAVQHAGGPHPDKSVDVHLIGLHLVLERGLAAPTVPPILQRVVATNHFPHFELPATRASMTVFDVAMASDPTQHVELSRKWATEVWRTWSHVHEKVRRLADAVV